MSHDGMQSCTTRPLPRSCLKLELFGHNQAMTWKASQSCLPVLGCISTLSRHQSDMTAKAMASLWNQPPVAPLQDPAPSLQDAHHAGAGPRMRYPRQISAGLLQHQYDPGRTLDESAVLQYLEANFGASTSSLGPNTGVAPPAFKALSSPDWTAFLLIVCRTVWPRLSCCESSRPS